MNALRKSKARGRHRARQAAAAKRERRRELRAAEQRGYAEHKREYTELVTADVFRSDDDVRRVVLLGQPPEKAHVIVDARTYWGDPGMIYEVRAVKQNIRIGDTALVWWGWEVAHGAPAW